MVEDTARPEEVDSHAVGIRSPCCAGRAKHHRKNRTAFHESIRMNLRMANRGSSFGDDWQADGEESHSSSDFESVLVVEDRRGLLCLGPGLGSGSREDGEGARQDGSVHWAVGRVAFLTRRSRSKMTRRVGQQTSVGF